MEAAAPLVSFLLFYAHLVNFLRLLFDLRLRVTRRGSRGALFKHPKGEGAELSERGCQGGEMLGKRPSKFCMPEAAVLIRYSYY